MAQALNEPQTQIQNEPDHVWPMSLILNPGYAMAFSCVKCQGVPKTCMNNEDGDILCSKCAQDMDKITTTKVVQKLINKLKTKCVSVSQKVDIKPAEQTEGSNINIIDTKVSDECDWTGQIQQYEEHGQACPFVVITCDKCNSFKCKRKLIDKHFGQCPEISIDCPLACGSKILRKNTEHHLQNVCVKQLLVCTNDDCKLEIERKSFKQHVDDECDSRIVHCEFKKYGCEMKHIRANNLKQHMDEYKFEHLSTKFDFVTTQLNNKIVNLESQVKLLNDESKESAQIHQELKEAIKQTNQTQELKYLLRMSSRYRYGPSGSQHRPPNCYEHLITDDENMGAATKSNQNAYIEAYLGTVKFVKYIEVKGCGKKMSDFYWYISKGHSCVIQYKNTNNQWKMLKDFRSQLMPSDQVTKIYVGQQTEAVRVFNQNGSASCGTLRVFGSSKKKS